MEYEDLPGESRCFFCGGDDDNGCPSCKPCGGVYAPGTEECDWCQFSESCEEANT